MSMRLLGCLVVTAFVSIVLSQGSNSGSKQEALDQPVCVLDYGQSIGVNDLSKSELVGSWCKKLPSKLPLSLMSIPGTHDAGTALGRTGLTRCQVLTVPAQLALGIRAFDIRLRLVGPELAVYHSEESQNLSFRSVLKDLKKFLRHSSSEFVVMRVREESKAIDPHETFESAFARIVAEEGASNLFYSAHFRTEIPTVGEVRGKILILDNYGKIPSSVDYPNSTMSVQDDYDTSDMGKKYQEIVSKFQDALSQTSPNVWNVNYTSSSTLEVDQLANARAVNAKVEEFLSPKRGHLGLVFMNFPGRRLIREIVDSNFGPAAGLVKTSKSSPGAPLP